MQHISSAILATFLSSFSPPSHAHAAPASFICHEQRSGDEREALRLLEVKEGVVSFLLFLSEPVVADQSEFPRACGTERLCGRLSRKGVETGSFEYDSAARRLVVFRPDTLFGPATVTRQPVLCAPSAP